MAKATSVISDVQKTIRRIRLALELFDINAKDVEPYLKLAETIAGKAASMDTVGKRVDLPTVVIKLDGKEFNFGGCGLRRTK